MWSLISHDTDGKGIPHEKHKVSSESEKRITQTETNATNWTLLSQRKNHVHHKIIIKNYNYYKETNCYECELANIKARVIYSKNSTSKNLNQVYWK